MSAAPRPRSRGTAAATLGGNPSVATASGGNTGSVPIIFPTPAWISSKVATVAARSTTRSK